MRAGTSVSLVLESKEETASKSIFAFNLFQKSEVQKLEEEKAQRALLQKEIAEERDAAAKKWFGIF